MLAVGEPARRVDEPPCALPDCRLDDVARPVHVHAPLPLLVPGPQRVVARDIEDDVDAGWHGLHQ